MNKHEIATKINDLCYDFDTYNFWDCYENRGRGLRELETIMDTNPDAITDIFRDIMESDDDDTKQTAIDIFSVVIAYYDRLQLYHIGDEIMEIMAMNGGIAA